MGTRLGLRFVTHPYRTIQFGKSKGVENATGAQFQFDGVMKLIWPRNRATVTLDQIKENSPTKKNRKKLNIDF